MRTWLSKIYHPATRNQMVIAMHKRTMIGCKEMVHTAIANCPIPNVAHYITRNYAANIERWALCVRQHSPLLLQITLTNALESYHSKLKRMTAKNYGLIGKYLINIIRIYKY